MLRPAGRRENHKVNYVGTLYETNQIAKGCKPKALDDLYYKDGVFSNKSDGGRYVGRWLTEVYRGVAAVSIACGLIEESENWGGASRANKTPKRVYIDHNDCEDAA